MAKQTNNARTRKSTKKNTKATKKKMKCPHCGYTWEPRVAKPKQCPVCKRYLI